MRAETERCIAEAFRDGWNGIGFEELLPKNQTINKDVYAGQLNTLRDRIAKKRQHKGQIHLLHDNARPLVAKLVQEKLQQFCWMVVPHPLYLPDLAPSDFHLFRSMQHFLNEQELNDDEEVKSAIGSFLDSKPASFYRSGIFALNKRWTYVAEHDGDYCPDNFDK